MPTEALNVGLCLPFWVGQLLGLWRRGHGVRAILMAMLGVLFIAGRAGAEPLVLTQLPQGSLGMWAQVYEESAAPLNLAQAQDIQAQGSFVQGDQPVLSSGIGSPARWLHLRLVNPGTAALPMQLVVGETWTDSLDVYVVHQGVVLANWRTGDNTPRPPGLIPGIGFAFSSVFQPGISDVFVRAEVIDSLVLPIYLRTPEQAAISQRWVQYLYGLFYGFLLALMAYNLMLYAGLRDRSYLFYCIYLASIVLLNASYTGHGSAWLWANYPAVQRFIIPCLMVLYSFCGLLFATHFLATSRIVPRVHRWVLRLVGAATIGITLAVITRNQFLAALLAFFVMLASTLGIMLLGMVATLRERESGTYFLAAAFFGMLGSALTLTSAYGLIPNNVLTYHGLEYGIVLEATLLALSLTHKHKLLRQAKELAQDASILDHEKALAAQKLVVETLRTSELALERRVAERTSELSATVEQLKKAQTDLVQSEKMASLGALVAGVAHELNTPIGNALMASSSMTEHANALAQHLAAGTLRKATLERYTRENSEIAELIQRSCERAAHLITSFKQVAVDQTSEHRRQFDLCELIADNVSAMLPSYKDAGWTLYNDVPSGIQCESYPGPLGQVIANLVQNADLHAFNHREIGALRISAKRLGTDVELCFADDGKGMSESTLAHVFDPFFTTALGKGGSGLGLAISRNIVTGVLGGSIHASSELGKGTRFVLQFPLAAPEHIPETG